MKNPAHYLLGLLMLATLPLFAQSTVQEEQPFTQAELDQMLAPVALYPDVLLSQVLMAATYPLEVVEAARWSRSHPELEGEAAREAVVDMDWDPSVQALVAFPELIQLMDENLSWTRKLGDAFLAQEEQVMTTAQALRRRAMEEGSLDEMEHVVVEEVEEVIVIEPREVEVVYVPYYRTSVVYGDWWWYDYPPYYWYPSSYYWSSSVAFHWSRPFHISTRFYFSDCDWHHRNVVIHRHPRPHRPGGYDRPDRDRHLVGEPRRPTQDDKERWHHDPDHRKGVRYHTGERPPRTVRADRSVRTDRREQRIPTVTRRDRPSSPRVQPTQPGQRRITPQPRVDSRQTNTRVARESRIEKRQPTKRPTVANSQRTPSQQRTTAPANRSTRAPKSAPPPRTSSSRSGSSNSKSYSKPSSSNSTASYTRSSSSSSNRTIRRPSSDHRSSPGGSRGKDRSP